MRFSSPAYLLLAFSFLFASGCAKFLEKFERAEDRQATEVRFSSGGASGLEALAVLNGKLLIYAVGAEPGGLRKTFRFDTEELANTGGPVQLKNGGYRFYFLGFSGSGMSTDVRCGRANEGQPVFLQGNPVVVQVTMSKGACTLPEFSANTNQNNAGTGFEPVKFVSCVSGLGIGGFTEASVCTGNKGDIAHHNSLKVEILGYETFQQAPASDEALRPGIESSCVKGDGRPGSNPVITTADTQANSVFALSNSVILFGLQGGEVFRSSNGGSSFSSSALGGQVRSIHGSGSNLVMGKDAGLYYSTDSGAGWTVSNVNAGTFNDVYAASSSVMLAAKASGEAYKSIDGGQSWTALAATGLTGGESIYSDPTGTHIYIGGFNSTNARLAYSSNGGSSFSMIYSPTGEGGVWTVKKLGAYLYWGTDAGLHRSINANGSSPQTFCASVCASSGRLPGNIVQDITLHENTLYVATSAGIGVSLGHDPANASSWDNYTAAELGAGNLNVQGIAFANGRLWQAVLGASDDPGRSTDSRGSGAAFPATSTVLLPTGGSAALPLTTRVTVYNDPNCQSARRSFLFPSGVGGGVVEPAGEAVFRSGAAAQTRLVLRDF